MSRFVFTCSQYDDEDELSTPVRTETSFDAESLSKLLENFGNFVRGCGFLFDGYIDIVDEYEEENGITRGELVEIGLEGWRKKSFDEEEK